MLKTKQVHRTKGHTVHSERSELVFRLKSKDTKLRERDNISLESNAKGNLSIFSLLYLICSEKHTGKPTTSLSNLFLHSQSLRYKDFHNHHSTTLYM